MSAPTRRSGFSAERFEQIYAAQPDPWEYETSDYERAKYRHTLAAIGDARYAHALEVGCSIGVFTSLLAECCRRVTAIDFSPRALALARRRLAAHPDVCVREAQFPRQVPRGPFDLIVCSEVLYYLGDDERELAYGWLAAQLESGARLVAVSWRGPGRDEPASGDAVHDRLRERLRRWHEADERRPGYRLDRFDARGV